MGAGSDLPQGQPVKDSKGSESLLSRLACASSPDRAGGAGRRAGTPTRRGPRARDGHAGGAGGPAGEGVSSRPRRGGRRRARRRRYGTLFRTCGCFGTGGTPSPRRRRARSRQGARAVARVATAGPAPATTVRDRRSSVPGARGRPYAAPPTPSAGRGGLTPRRRPRRRRRARDPNRARSNSCP